MSLSFNFEVDAAMQVANLRRRRLRVLHEVEFRLRVGRFVLNLRLIFRFEFEFAYFRLRLSFNVEAEAEAEF